jgi:hypothetical protein
MNSEGFADAAILDGEGVLGKSLAPRGNPAVGEKKEMTVIPAYSSQP